MHTKLLSILIITSVTILSTHQNQPTPQLHYPSVCTSNQTAMIAQAINACQLNSISDSVVCIRDYIRQKYDGQTWNVFVKNTDANLDTVVFWYINKCVAQLTNYGTLNRTYLIWMHGIGNQTSLTSLFKEQTQKSLADTKILNQQNVNIQNEQNLRYISQINAQSPADSNDQQITAATCPDWKISTVQRILLICDLPQLDSTANCITNMIKEQLNEYWYVYVSSSQISPSDMTGYYVQCIKVQPTFGVNSRYIKASRARSILNY